MCRCQTTGHDPGCPHYLGGWYDAQGNKIAPPGAPNPFYATPFTASDHALRCEKKTRGYCTCGWDWFALRKVNGL